MSLQRKRMSGKGSEDYMVMCRRRTGKERYDISVA